MADDKGSTSSGSQWGALEIIIGIVLLIGLLDRLTGRTPNTISDDISETTVEEISSWCGLTVESPKPKEKVDRVITLRGTAGDCDWQSTKNAALYAQVVDSKGKPVSEYLAIPPENTFDESWGGPVSFVGTVSLTGKPAAGIGYLILVPAIDSGGQQSVSARIPLTFSK